MNWIKKNNDYNHLYRTKNINISIDKNTRRQY